MISTNVEKRMEKVKKEGILPSCELVKKIEREELISKVEELEKRILQLEKFLVLK